MNANPDFRPYRDNFEHLNDELHHLDLLIRLRTMTLALHNQAIPEAQAERTVYITPQEVMWLLEQNSAPGRDNTAVAEIRAELARRDAEISCRVEQSQQKGVFLALPQLNRLFGLSAFEQEALVICLAPELRHKYDRLYAYLQDDITRKRPSVDLVLGLLCETETERWQARGLFSETAPLMRAGLLQKVEDFQSPSGSSGLAQLLKLDPHICNFLLGSAQIDSRLTSLTQFHHPLVEAGEPLVEAEIAVGLKSLVAHHLAPDKVDRRRLVLYLHGPCGVGKRELALHICGHLGAILLSLDIEVLLAQGAEAENLLRLAFREGLLQQAILYLESIEALWQDAARPLLKTLAVAIDEYGWLLFLSGEGPWSLKEAFPGAAFHSVAVPVPDVALRHAVWERCLEGRTTQTVAYAAQLAAQFRLTPGQIREAAELAENLRIMRPEQDPLALTDLMKACRLQAKHKLGELAVKIEPHYSWEDIVLPEEKLDQLKEICSQVQHHYQVLSAWGFGKKLSHGKGLSVLFTGSPGTGKTMAAEVLARDLELDLYKVDLSGVVSKYIGETEKNLSRIFQEAEKSNALLFFDEADALFGKRTVVSDAHDRYANIEISYLLQKMEAYEGVVILATNLRENMDEGFTRRLRFIVEFPFPHEIHRRRIWETHFPATAPVLPEIDYAFLAREFQVAGGNIKNIVLNAAFQAAADDGAIGMRHLLHGAKREFEKIGKLWPEQLVPGGPKQ